LFPELLPCQDALIQPQQSLPLVRSILHPGPGAWRTGDFEFGLALQLCIDTFLADNVAHEFNCRNLRLIVLASLFQAESGNHAIQIQ